MSTVSPCCAWEGADEAFDAAIDALLTAARTGTAHPCDARFGLRVTEILARAEERMRAA